MNIQIGTKQPIFRTNQMVKILIALGLCIPLTSTITSAQSTYVWENLAGSGTSINQDGIQGYAGFVGTNGLAKDSAGNVFVASFTCIKKISPSGVVTTFAGVFGSQGATNAIGTSARFFSIGDLTIDSSDNLYASDQHCIRKITPAGLVTTLAGTSGSPGYTNGTGSAATFYYPLGITCDGSNLYVADTYNYCLRKITSAGVVTLFAGNPGNSGFVNGTGLTAKFSYPRGIGVDGSANVFVSDNGFIRKIASGTSTVSTTTIPGGVLSVDSSGAMLVGDGTGVYLANSTAIVGTISKDNYNTLLLKGSTILGGHATGVSRASVKSGGYGWVGLAGSTSTYGGVNGVGPLASFAEPLGMTVDLKGNTYVADMTNHVIRKINPSGEATVYAGSIGISGDADGSEALFTTPAGVTMDSAGNLFVSDIGTHTIRKVQPNGYVTTVAGTSFSAGTADGNGISASFNTPYGICAVGTTIYVADTGSHTIRRILAAGNTVTTIAGFAATPGSANGWGSAARFNSPTGICYSKGSFYIADYGNHVIRKMNGTVVSTAAGVPGSPASSDGTGTGARFSYPYQIAAGTGAEIYVSDAGTGKARRIDYDGVVSTVNISTSGVAWAGGLAVSRYGELILNDSWSYIAKGAPGSHFKWSNFAGDGTSFASGNLDGPGSTARFDQPLHICADPSGTSMWMIDFYNYRARNITTGGAVSSPLNFTGSAPMGVAVDAAGSNVYLACDNEQVIYKSNYVTSNIYAGSSYNPGAVDGPLLTARFQDPRSLAMDGSGNIYVADSFNYTIRKISSGGTVSTLAGSAGVSGTVDGTGSAARFYYPVAVALDSSNNVYVSDYNVIRKISPSGVVTTIAGSPTQAAGAADGPNNFALFSQPQGLSVDSNGEIYVADNLNSSIRKIDVTGNVTTISPPGFFGNTVGITKIGANLYATDPYHNRLAKGTYNP